MCLDFCKVKKLDYIVISGLQWSTEPKDIAKPKIAWMECTECIYMHWDDYVPLAEADNSFPLFDYKNNQTNTLYIIDEGK